MSADLRLERWQNVLADVADGSVRLLLTGSATVGRACIDLGRRFVGAERVPKYHAIGTARLAQTSIFDRIGVA